MAFAPVARGAAWPAVLSALSAATPPLSSVLAVDESVLESAVSDVSWAATIEAVLTRDEETLFSETPCAATVTLVVESELEMPAVDVEMLPRLVP